MSNSISTNYQLPFAAQAQATANTSSDTSNSMSATSIGSTFLNLLTQELQNQDPTAPMDSTAMVGQMISLNQLDQLININQTLSGVTQPQVVTPASTAAKTAGQPQTTSPTPQAAAASVLPFDPTTLMPVATTAARQSNPLKIAAINLSSPSAL